MDDDRWEWVDGCWRHGLFGKGWARVWDGGAARPSIACLVLYQDDGELRETFHDADTAKIYVDAIITGLVRAKVLT